MEETKNKLSKETIKMRMAYPLDLKEHMTYRRVFEFYRQVDPYLSISGGLDSLVLDILIEEKLPEISPYIPRVFCDTGLEYDSIRRAARNRADTVINPEMRFDKVIATYGFPLPTKTIAQNVRKLKTSMERGTKETLREKLFAGTFENPKKPGKLSPYNIPQWAFLLEQPFDVSDMCCDIMKKNPFLNYESSDAGAGRCPITGERIEESLNRQKNYMKSGCNRFTGSGDKRFGKYSNYYSIFKNFSK